MYARGCWVVWGVIVRSRRAGDVAPYQEGEGFGGPGLFADGGDVWAFGGADEFVGEEGHVLFFEVALVVLVVGAFVEGEGAGLVGCDLFAGDGVEDGAALAPGVGAGDFGDGD